jgi:hypothetical protein
MIVTLYGLLVLSLVALSPRAPGAHHGRLPAGAPIADELLSLGLLDVTKPPYSADSTGKNDSTTVIRRAVNDARDKGLVCFFPLGTYLISDTLSCEQQNYRLDAPRAVDGQIANYWHRNHRVILMGSNKGGKRPVLRLSRDAKGFDDPAHPKMAVWIWARTWFGDGTGEQPNISFGHYFIGIDIDVRGHAGAIGLKHSGSQGCTLQDSTIYADGAFAGLYNCPGQAAGTFNVEVIGGDYGFFADSRSRFPILIGCRFRNQNKAAVRYTGGPIQVPTLLVACLIETRAGQAVDLTTEPSYGGISMVDCIIRTSGGVAVATRKKENVYLESTYIKGAPRVTSGGQRISSPDKWTLVRRFSSHAEGAMTLVNGKVSSDEVHELQTVASEPDFAEIRARHWKPRPSFEDADAVNVKTFGAKGDGVSDDTSAFETAIRHHDKVFVPPGYYKLTGDLILEKSTQLFSLSPFLTTIGAGRGMRGAASEPTTDGFTLSTPNTPDASPGLWFLAVGGRIRWTSGNGTCMHARGRYAFSGNAGGRLYAISAMGDQFLVENVRNPLSFYSLNVERVTHNPQAVIRNSQKIRIYYYKVEAGTRNAGETGGGDENTPGSVQNSRDVHIYCMYGNVKGLAASQPMLEIVDSKNIVVSQLKAFFPDVFPHLKEVIGTAEQTLPSLRQCALYIRD